MTTEEAVDFLTNKLKKDWTYRESWKANIAMAYIDNENWYKKKTKRTILNRWDKHVIANEAAEYFLKQLCGELKCPKGR